MEVLSFFCLKGFKTFTRHLTFQSIPIKNREREKEKKDRSPVLRAAFWLHVPLHTDVLTSSQPHRSAADLHHVTAAHSEHEVRERLHSQTTTTSTTILPSLLQTPLLVTHVLQSVLVYLQLFVPPLLKPWGQLLTTAQEVQEVYMSSL